MGPLNVRAAIPCSKCVTFSPFTISRPHTCQSHMLADLFQSAASCILRSKLERSHETEQTFAHKPTRNTPLPAFTHDSNGDASQWAEAGNVKLKSRLHSLTTFIQDLGWHRFMSPCARCAAMQSLAHRSLLQKPHGIWYLRRSGLDMQMQHGRAPWNLLAAWSQPDSGLRALVSPSYLRAAWTPLR